MGLFDSAKDKASELAGDNKDKVDEGVEKAGDAVDDKTGGKFSDQIDSGQDAAKDKLGDL
ncbi:antitoxin [Flexivirga sp. B27]